MNHDNFIRLFNIAFIICCRLIKHLQKFRWWRTFHTNLPKFDYDAHMSTHTYIVITKYHHSISTGTIMFYSKLMTCFFLVSLSSSPKKVRTKPYTGAKKSRVSGGQGSKCQGGICPRSLQYSRSTHDHTSLAPCQI